MKKTLFIIISTILICAWVMYSAITAQAGEKRVMAWDSATGDYYKLSQVVVDDTTKDITFTGNMLVAGSNIYTLGSATAIMERVYTTDLSDATNTVTIENLKAIEDNYAAGPASSNDNIIPRFDGTTGKKLQTTGITCDDSDNLTGINDLTAGGTIQGGTLTDGTFTTTGGVTSTTLMTATKVYATLDLYVNDVGLNDTGGGGLAGSSLIGIPTLNTPTYTTVYDRLNNLGSSGSVSGGVISDAGSETINVAAGTGLIKATDSDVAEILSFDWAASNGIAIPTNTVRYVGIEYNAGAPQVVVKTTDTWDYDTDFPLGIVVNEAADLHILNNPMWISDAFTNIIERFDGSSGHMVRDERLKGLILGETGTRNVTVTTGALLDRLSEYPITAIDTSVADTFDSYYRDGGSGFTKVSAETQWDNGFWDDDTGTLNSVGNNKYAVLWFYLEADGHIVVLYGRTEHNNAASAETEELPNTTPIRLATHAVPLGRLIFESGGATAEKVESAFETFFHSTLASDHANLANLAWSTAGHTGDLTLTGDLLFSADAIYQIGAATERAERLYVVDLSDATNTVTIVNIFDKSADTLDDITDGSTYKKVHADQINAANRVYSIANDTDGLAAFYTNSNSDLLWTGDRVYQNDELFINAETTDSLFMGYRAGQNNTGTCNHGFGNQTLFNNKDGDDNSAFGCEALFSNISGNKNSAYGYQALYSNTTGNNSSAYGYQCLYTNTIGIRNSAHGTQVLYSNTEGNNNTGIGQQALFDNTTGDENTGGGYRALYENIDGLNNSAYGSNSLTDNTGGSSNTASGYQSLANNTTGDNNTATGQQALLSNVDGDNNTAVGYRSFYLNTSGNGNVGLGYQSGYNETGSNKLYISNTSTTNPLIYGEFDNNIIRFTGDILVSSDSIYQIGSATAAIERIYADDIDLGTNIWTDTLAGYVDQDVTSGSAPTFTADNFSDGGSNAIVTTTQETNWDTHLTSDGSDHTFIDQSVVIAGTPTFASLTLTNALYLNDTASGIYENDATDDLEFYDANAGGYTLSQIASAVDNYANLTLDNVCDNGSTTDQTITAGGFTTAGTITDGTLSIASGSITAAVNITASAQVKAEHLYTTDDMYVTDEIKDGDGLNPVTVAELNTAYDHSQDNTQAHTDYLLNSGADAVGGDIDFITSYQVVNLQAPSAAGEALRQTATLTEATLEAAVANYTDADNISDGSTNAIVTLTQETNWDTHLSSNGTDHTYIDQDVTTSGTPTFSKITATLAIYLQDTATQLYEDGSGNLNIGDAVTGYRTLAQLAASGGGASAHTDLTDMPDSSGTDTGHDVRYVAQVQAAAPTTPTPYEGMIWLDNDATAGGGGGGTTIAAWQIWAATNEIYKIGVTGGLYSSPYGDGFYFGTGVPVFGTSAKNVIAIEAGTDPVTSPANMIQLYAREYDSYTKLMLHLNGADGATSTTDSSDSNHTITFNNNCELDTAIKKFGTASLLCPGGAADAISAPSSSDWNFGTGDFTVECWIYIDVLETTSLIASEWFDGSWDMDGKWMLYIYSDGDIAFGQAALDEIVTTDTPCSSISTWYHVAVVRHSGVLDIYVDGVSHKSAAYTSDLNNNGDNLNVGSNNNTDFNGSIDEVRISKGVARWTANFNKPITDYSGCELRVRDENGNITTLSTSAEVSPDCDCPYPVIKKKKNYNIGKSVEIRECCQARNSEDGGHRKVIWVKDIPITKELPEGKILPRWLKTRRESELIKREDERLVREAAYLESLLKEDDEPDTGVIIE